MEVQAGEDYVCSVCKHAGLEPGPVHMDIVSLQEEVETRMEVEEEIQPAPSDAGSEPVQIHNTELDQPMAELVEDTEQQQPGKIKTCPAELRINNQTIVLQSHPVCFIRP